MILKILGIVLLCLIGLVLLILLTVLLVPVRYEVRASYRDEIRARAKVHWLLRAVLVKLEWMKDCGLLRARALGFISLLKKQLGDWGPEPAPEGEAAEDPLAEMLESLDAELPPGAAERTADTGIPSDTEYWTEIPAEEMDAYAEQPAKGIQKLFYRKNKENSFKKAPKKEPEEEKPPKEKRSFGERLDELEGKKDRILEQLEDEQNRGAARLILKQLKRILKQFLPRKLEIDGRIGMEDPALTGQLMGLAGCLMPLYGEHVKLEGVYDRQEMQFKLSLKGRIRLGVFLAAALRLLLNRRIRQWLKKLLKKDKSGDTEAGPKPEGISGADDTKETAQPEMKEVQGGGEQ